MTLDQQRTPPSGELSLSGPLAADISNAVVRLVREHFGKGPTQAKTLLHDDAVVTILRGGFTHAEKTLYKAGRADIVDEGRRAMQDVFQRAGVSLRNARADELARWWFLAMRRCAIRISILKLHILYYSAPDG